MTLKNTYPWPVKLLVRLMLVGVIVFFLTEARELLIPLTFAGFIALILLPVSKWLENHKFPRTLAITLSILLAIVVFGGFIYFLYKQGASFGDDWDEIKKQVGIKMNSIHQFMLDNFSVTRREQNQWLNNKLSTMMNAGGGIALTIFTTTGTLITSLILIPFYIFFLTYYREKIKTFVSLVTQSGDDEKVIGIMYKVSAVAQKYLKGLLIDVAVNMTLLTIAFLLLGIKHALLFGALVAVMNIILPYMGLTVGSIFPFLMALITKDSFGSALGVVIVCVACQFIDNHFVNPYVVGTSVSINPMTAFIAIVCGALIWGIFGMIICIPVTGMIKVVCDHVDKLQPYGYIIGHEVKFVARQKKKKSVIAMDEK